MKKLLLRIAFLVVCIFIGVASLFAADRNQLLRSTEPHLVVANDDVPTTNTATFYLVGTDGSLKQTAVVRTGGSGLGAGFFGTNRVNVLQGKSNRCAYISDAGSNDIAGILVRTLKKSGRFKGSANDKGSNGLGLALNGKYLYANFTGSNTIATFKILCSCRLHFMGDVAARGLGGGTVEGMAANGKMLVVAYADGSIESFNISKGKPVSNGDAQNSSGSASGGIDITQDGHFAIFGDSSTTTSQVEVSDISSGKLISPVVSKVGTGVGSSNIWLSPDESLLYVSNNTSGQVSAGFFNPIDGSLKESCTSTILTGFGTSWLNTGALGTSLTTGLGGVVYVAEDGQPSSIGVVIPQKGTERGGVRTCTLTEQAGSPASDPNSKALLSIGVYPPRPF